MPTGLKVLIIEDRRENIVFLANNILKPKGFDVITAMDGESGLRKALEEHPDLIITDLKLPKMTGLEVLADLQDRGSNIPTIVMTFHGSEETAIDAFRLGAKDYLIKPFNVETIEKALDRAIGSGASNPSPAEASLRQHAQALEARVAELEKIIQTQEQSHASPSTPSPMPEDWQQQIASLKQGLEKRQREYAQLAEELNQQKELTTEARNSAKAMVQFIRSQQKELLRQKQVAVEMNHQVQSLSGALADLLSSLDAQVRQFPT